MSATVGSQSRLELKMTSPGLVLVSDLDILFVSHTTLPYDKTCDNEYFLNQFFFRYRLY